MELGLAYLLIVLGLFVVTKTCIDYGMPLIGLGIVLAAAGLILLVKFG